MVIGYSVSTRLYGAVNQYKATRFLLSIHEGALRCDCSTATSVFVSCVDPKLCLVCTCQDLRTYRNENSKHTCSRTHLCFIGGFLLFLRLLLLQNVTQVSPSSHELVVRPLVDDGRPFRPGQLTHHHDFIHLAREEKGRDNHAVSVCVWGGGRTGGNSIRRDTPRCGVLKHITPTHRIICAVVVVVSRNGGAHKSPPVSTLVFPRTKRQDGKRRMFASEGGRSCTDR